MKLYLKSMKNKMFFAVAFLPNAGDEPRSVIVNTDAYLKTCEARKITPA